MEEKKKRGVGRPPKAKKRGLVEGVDYTTPKPMSAKQEMILKNESQLLIIGGAMGSGKTYLQQMLALKYIDDKNTQVVNFRRTTKEVTGQGGVFDTAHELYDNLHPSFKPAFIDSRLQCTFPSGAKVTWNHMEYAKDAKKNQGLQFTICNFDEGTTFEWGQIEYMFQRMRSKSKYPSRIIISCNPDPDHELAGLVEWYLDEEGYPREDRCGVERYFIRRGGEFIWGDTRKSLADKFDIAKKDMETKILSFTFISATIYDNPVNMEQNPEYLAFLEGMNDIDKARNLHGNWYARPLGSKYFQREWLVKVDKKPLGCIAARAWDKASTEPSDKNKFPDYTACSPIMSKDNDGFYYLEWNVDEAIKDEDTEVLGRFRKRAGERDRLIEKQAKRDGSETTIIFAVDPGQSGKVEFQESAKKLIEEGFTVKSDPMPSNKSKLTRFTPFASACENGLVRVVESSFPNKVSLEAFYSEMEAFDGERSSNQRKDDYPDATASCFNHLSRGKVLRPFSMSGNTGAHSSTKKGELMSTPIPDIN